MLCWLGLPLLSSCCWTFCCCCLFSFVFFFGLLVVPLLSPQVFLHWKTLYFHKSRHCFCSVIHKEFIVLVGVLRKPLWLHFKNRAGETQLLRTFFLPLTIKMFGLKPIKLEAVAPAGLESLESGYRWADGRWAVSQGWWLVYLQEEFSGHTVGTAAPSRLIHGTGMVAVLEKSASPGQR